MAQAIPYIGKLVMTAVAAKAVGSAMKPDTPVVTAPEKELVAPTPDDPTTKRKRQRQAMRKYGAGGRAGTELTDDSKLG